MAERISKEARSRIMAAVRSKNTRPEMAVRRAVHRLGYRFRLHRRDLPGTPDLVFPRLKAVVQVFGCFFHRHPHCPNATMPKTRIEYWTAKFAANQRRDAASLAELRCLGWHTLVIWECEIGNGLAARLSRFLRSAERHQPPANIRRRSAGPRR